tara:strand:- start:242 stop:430 length:189 start_codon:yes stop_codon:yes gene_type:complete
MATSKKMTKAEALFYFKELYKMSNWSRSDSTAKREMWNNYTDSLCKNGDISLKQYENWDQPF